MKKTAISILMGSSSDLVHLKDALNLLKGFKVGFEVKVLSAHRTPKELVKYIEASSKKGIKVYIAAAGGSAALAGVVAAHTLAPVIGIPIETRSLKGIDSLLSTVQMPSGVPVASVALGKSGAKNAVILALEILALNDEKIKSALLNFRKDFKKSVLKQKIKL